MGVQNRSPENETIVSYAQNLEDVMLWRALKHVKNGFYIDVGAFSPESDSVTKLFYDHGWQGINIEPNPKFHNQLVDCRTRDINLRMAVGETTERVFMNFTSNFGLSTLDDKIAKVHEQSGFAVNRKEVKVTTLANICEQYVPKGKEIHFLKVDIEGYEEAALPSNNWDKFRPWILVIEAFLPLSQAESHQSWEPTLFSANYKFVYADGLNRFYLAQEHQDLIKHFTYPPNVWDNYQLAGLYEQNKNIQQLSS